MAQRLEMGIQKVQEDTHELKITCGCIDETLKQINVTMAHHLGEHEGLEKASKNAGRKYGIIYGCGSVIIAILGFLVANWGILSSTKAIAIP